MVEDENNEDISNELNTIHQLPDEILGDIFLTNTQQDQDQGDGSRYDPFATLLSVSKVCKRWHEVAFNYPLLWSRIIDSGRHRPELIDDLLRRSKLAPIDVGGDSAFNPVLLREPRATKVLHLLSQHTSRIKTFNVNIRLRPWEFICQNFLKHPAPILEFLNLVTSAPFPECLFAGPLFSGDAPCLKRLHLQRCLIDFSSIVLHNLTELSVLDVLAPPILSMNAPDHPLKVAPTVLGWLRVLENMPSLHYLTLSNAISSSRTDDSDLLFRVHLPHLLLLTVGAKFHDGATFIDHLKVPPACGIRSRFTCQKSPSGAEGLRLLSFLSHQVYHWPKDSPSRYLQAKLLSGERVHFGNSKRIGHIWDMTEAEVIREHVISTPDPLVWLVLNFDGPEDTIGFFNNLLSLYEPTYPATTNLDLWVDAEYTPTNSNTSAFSSLEHLYSFTGVKTLNLLSRSSLYLLSIFHASSRPGQHFFPSLKTLRLARTNFEDDQPAYSTVIAYLHWRVNINAPLTELQVIDGKISEETEETLKRIGNIKVSLEYSKFPPAFAGDN